MKWEDAIPWLLAIIGWFVVHVFSEARERRKDIKSQLDKLINSLSSLEEEAIKFHTSPSFQADLSRKINYSIDRIERNIRRIQILSYQHLLPHIISHKRSITLDNFDKSTFKQQNESSDIVHEISNATFSLEDEIENQYIQHYPMKFPFFSFWGS